MAVYLGNAGKVLIGRSGGKQPYIFTLNNSDINVDRRRFSVRGSGSQFITGDVLEISTLPTQDNIPLELVPGNKDASGRIHNDFRGFAYVDALGGIRLFKTLDDAIDGQLENAVELGLFAAGKQDVMIRLVPQFTRNCLAHVTGFEITTTRENIDTTCLSNRFRQEYEDGLIQGQGKLDCFWDYRADLCDEFVGDRVEFAEYLAHLCLRVVQGCDFHGYFYLYDSPDDDLKSTWYECSDCLVTNVVVNVEPTQIVTASVEFITSGPIQLRHGYPPKFLLTEADFNLLTEAGRPILLENTNL